MYELRPYDSNNKLYYNPFREMDELERRLFDEPFGTFFGNGDIAEFKTDIRDEGDKYILEADLPGFDKKDIHLDLTDNTLVINAERHSEHEETSKKNKYVRVERSYGKYSRRFDVSNIDIDQMKAKFENGVLSLTMPKKQVKLPDSKRLEID